MKNYASIILAVFSIVGVIFVGLQLRGEVIERKDLEEIVLAREPEIGYLKPFIQEATESFWVVIPIINKSTSSLAIGHKVQVSVTFKIDNLIKRIDADPFIVIGGWEGGHSANLELSVLYPGTIIYTSFLVNKPQLPDEITISWAEETGMQAIPLR